ncbi:MAG: hypothetical protein A2998_03375 [Candidatus Staskawiczbacteria bacterium RIFCSPLOWO2_01_FULL_37_25b]|uniref:Uncharacterized protein n=1 Tax=Candidatus Staskawiczbacteria bacterium RIFCSPLOWO2_01_FULL_37_25b TaxID=1802213 RepID=A0A1G2ICB0_9BACT|nr:MAG: hypothetical protein A2998_03375 [Candidatus Staskawiczbacteria bacterium RIFCSPLOWO2_01_FULL_37_25b]
MGWSVWKVVLRDNKARFCLIKMNCVLSRKGCRMATQHLTIVDGPSKFELMLGLFDVNSTNPRLVHFILAGGWPDPWPVLLSGVSKEDGSGENWLFTGYHDDHQVKGYFSTRTRKGRLDLVE